MAGTCKARVPMAEQIRLINECRQSGMTDADWCRENDIVVSTFPTGSAAVGKRQRIRSQQRITVILRFHARNRMWSPLTLCRITFPNSTQHHRCRTRALIIHIPLKLP